MDLLHILFLLGFCCALLIVRVVEAGPFPVCSTCDCSKLPKTLDGRVVDVPASVRVTEYHRFDERIKAPRTVVVLFRSTDPKCSVEVRLESIHSTVQFIVYPAGRSDLTIASDYLGPVTLFCKRYNDWSSYLFPGLSVVSTGPELAFAFLKTESQRRINVDVQLLYRRYCNGTKDTVGFPLPAPSVDGSSQRQELSNAYMLNTVPGVDLNDMYWSVPSVEGCAIDVTFTKSSPNAGFGLNGLVPALVGITHRVPQGVEATIQLWKRDSIDDFAGVAAMTVEYHAAECGAPVGNSTKVQIASWNDIVRTLTPTDAGTGSNPIQTINFTFPNRGAEQIAIWYFSGFDNTYVPFYAEDQFNIWDGIPDRYRTEFETRFNSSMWPGTTPFVFFSGAMNQFSVSFHYAFLSANAPPVLLATASNFTFTTLKLTPQMVAARTLYIEAENKSCAVEVARGNGWAGPVSTAIHVLLFGFNSSQNDILDAVFEDDYIDDSLNVGSSLRRQPLRSVGSIMGIQLFRLIDLETSPVSLRYRTICPVHLNTVLPPDEWRYVSGSNGKAYLLREPPMPKGGKRCWVDVSGTSVPGVLPRDRSLILLVTCLQDPTRSRVLRDRQTTAKDLKCLGTLEVDVYGSRGPRDILRNNTIFAYRVRCDDEAIGKDGGLAPIPPLDKAFIAVNEWRTLETEVVEYETTSSGSYLRNTWMLQAKNPSCHVEITFDHVENLLSMEILEDFMWNFRSTASGQDLTTMRVKHLRYRSCNDRVFLVGLPDGVGTGMCRYRQVCEEGKPGFRCSQDMTVEPSLDGKWHSLQAKSNGNLNQLHQLQYYIAFPNLTRNLQTSEKVLELEFASVVSGESWNGDAAGPRGLGGPFAETHDVRIHNTIGAVVGKEYLFKESVSIQVDALLRTEKGDHLFTVRYRLVDEKQAHQEVRLGEVLEATSNSKTLETKIPQQFSIERLHESFRRGEIEYETRFALYGDVPMWLFRHQYTIRPSHPSCQVAFRVTRMDIGSGYVSGSQRRYSNEQHRLAVLTDGNAVRYVPIFCASDIFGDTPRPNETECARMDRTYVSPPGAPLKVVFRSLNGPKDEYEYETGGLNANGVNGNEVTFGTRWTATYQQICDKSKAKKLATVPVRLVRAKQGQHANDWEENLPGMFKSDQYRLFRDRRWLITPQRAGCEVQYMVEVKKAFREPIPLVFQVGAAVKVPLANKLFTSPNVTVIQLGSSKNNRITIKYRQNCSQVATTTESPSRAPTSAPSRAVPAGSRHDGETCIRNQECSSTICSTTLLRCTSKMCSSQCTSKKSSQAMCTSYAANGCSCEWIPNTRSCIPVP